jgi:hypothetical protein
MRKTKHPAADERGLTQIESNVLIGVYQRSSAAKSVFSELQ